ncbi:MAG: sigma-70 family RNA polymerase sigma factor [Hyphomicrobiales bacterium]
MHLAAPMLMAARTSPAAYLSPTGRRAALSLIRRPLPMSNENRTAFAAPPWARLINEIASRQDRAAFAELFEYFAPRIKTFLQRSGSTEARAEELAQEAMLAVWRKAALYDPAHASASTWIFTIARNLRIDAYRRENRGGVSETTDIELEFQVDQAQLPDAMLAASQIGQRVQTAMAELSDEQLRVIELSFFEEKAHAEIARILQIPLGTVKSRLRLAMGRLRILLDELS